jgi:hypothetical protein
VTYAPLSPPSSRKFVAVVEEDSSEARRSTPPAIPAESECS